MIQTALVLAGGFATRLWPLTEHRAKPLLLLQGKTILAHILDKIPEDVETYVLTNARFADAFTAELLALGRPDIKIFLEDSVEDAAKLGALGAVSAAIKHFDIHESVALLAGDNILTGFCWNDLQCSDNQARLLVRDIHDIDVAKKFGVVMAEGALVTGFEEKPAAPKSTLVSTGFFAIGKDYLPVLHQSAADAPDNLGGVVPDLLKAGCNVLATTISGDWYDVGSFETYLQAHKDMSHTCCYSDIETKNTYYGAVWVHPSAQVQGCVLRDALVYADVKLTDCTVTQTVIDAGADLSGLDLHGKLIRAGTVQHG